MAMETFRHSTMALLLAALLAGCGGSSGDDEGSGPLAPPAEPPQGVWLKGDFHLHSDHSDDAADNPIATLVPLAESRGMDFFLITDHDNHVEGNLTTWDDPAYVSDSMVMLYGAEWTTEGGHATTVAAQRYDHAALYATREGDGRRIAERAHAMGVHFSANHPLNGDPWLYGFDIGLDSMEVWNALYKFPSDNEQHLALWDELAGQGLRLAGRGGSDCHHQEGIEPLGVNIGTPTTWVFAGERTGKAILDAVKQGRVAVSYAPGAPRAEFTADVDRDGVFETMMGDNRAAGGEPVAFRVRVEGGGAALLRVVVKKNGALLQEQYTVGGSLDFEDTPAKGERSFYRVEVHGSTLAEAETAPAWLIGFYGSMVSLGNPIWFGF